MRRAALLAILLGGLAGCGLFHRRVKPAPPTPPIRTVLESAYQAGGLWFYPHQDFGFAATGLAAIAPPGHGNLTTDNEAYDPNAMAAAMQTIRLPAIATVTNLDSGRAVVLRVNDRGPDAPSRLIAVTPRVALLLAFAGPVARVRVQLDPERSAALAHQLQGHAADIAIEAAPRAAVGQTALAPLAGTAEERARGIRQTVAVAQIEAGPALIVPLRLPDAVQAGSPEPGPLMIEAGQFSRAEFARDRIGHMPDLDARIERVRRSGQTSYFVRAGPFPSVADADAALARIVADGISDARIVVQVQ